MPLGVRRQLLAGSLQRQAVADAGDDVEQRLAGRVVHDDIVGGDERQVEALGQAATLRELAARARAIGHGGADPQAAGAGVSEAGEGTSSPAQRGRGTTRRVVEGAATSWVLVVSRREADDEGGCGGSPLHHASHGSPPPRCGGGCVRLFGVVLVSAPGDPRVDLRLEARAGQGDELQTLMPCEQVGEQQPTGALLGADVARRQQPAEAAVGVAVARVGEDVGRAVAEDEPRADHHAQAPRDLPVVT